MKEHRDIVRSFYFIVLAMTMYSCGSERLPSIEITKEDAILYGVKSPCELVYKTNSSADPLKGNIKWRGGHSRRYDKHSYSLELDSDYSLGELPADDDWVLNASYIDKTFMRHKISYDIYRQMDKSNIAPRCSYASLKINGDYQGLYIIMEEINGGMVGLDKKDSQAMLFKDPPIFYHNTLSSVQDSLNYYQQKFPKIKLDEKSYYLDRFRTFLFESSDQVFADSISVWVDLDNIIDWHLLLLFSNNSDGIMKNFYLYKLNAATPFRIAIWDYDHSFGRDGDNELNMMDRALDCNRSVLIRRLSEIPKIKYQQRLKSRWRTHRNNGTICLKNLANLVASNNTKISCEIQHNAKKWPISSTWYFDDNDYAQEKDLLLRFVELRLGQIDRYFEGI